MDCVEAKQEAGLEIGIEDTSTFDGNTDSVDINDPFNNSDDELIDDNDIEDDPFNDSEGDAKDYDSEGDAKDYDSEDDPFKDYDSEDDPFKEKEYQDTHVLKDQVVKETPSSGVPTILDYTQLAIDKYSCKHCEYVTHTRKIVDNHIRRKHMQFLFRHQCPHCPYKGDVPFQLKKHIRNRHKNASEVDWYRCHQCSFKSKYRPNFTAHMDTHRSVEEINSYRTLKCDRCLKMFKRKSDLRRHVDYVHNKHKQKLLKCHWCDHTTYALQALQKHKKSFHDERLATLRCDQCTYKTHSKYLLEKHSKVHAKEFKFQCEKCPYRATIMTHMKLHSISHQKVKNEKDLKYRCDKCDYKTYRDYSLKVHKLKHLKPEEIEYFYCYHCDFKAKRKENLKTHIQNHFKKKSDFVCFVCDFKTKNKVIYLGHIDEHSKKQKEEQSILNGNPSDGKGKRKRQSSSNDTKKDPLKRRKGQNDDDEPENLEINESVSNVSRTTRLGKHLNEQNKKLKSEANHADQKDKLKGQNSSDEEKKAPLTRRRACKTDKY